MLTRKFDLVVVICILCACLAPRVDAQLNQWRLIHGNVLRIFPQANKIMLESDGNTFILILEEDCEIIRHGFPTTLESLRPVTSTDFQDALCWVNPRGLIGCILVNYFVYEEEGSLFSLDIFGNVK